MTIKLNLRYVTSASFSKSAYNQVVEFMKSSRRNRDLIQSLKDDDVIAFVSKGGNQVRFVYRIITAGKSEESKRQLMLVMFLQQRCIHGTYSAATLGNLAKMAGLELVNYPLFETFYRELAEEAAR